MAELLATTFFHFKRFLKTMIFSLLLTLLLGLGLGIGFGASAFKWFYQTIFLRVPEKVQIETKGLGQASYYYDNEDNEIYREYHDVNRTLIPLKDLPPNLINAIIAIEDREFYEHQGISPKALLRAGYLNYYVKVPQLQGGSTITQQLAKNIFLSSEQSLQRKLTEMVYAWRIEQSYTKDEILELYLNTVSFGGTAYGIEAAAQQYFHKNAKDLSLAESSLLAGMVAAPTEYSPYSDFEKTRLRQKSVLFAMQETGKIAWPDVRKAYWENISIHPPENNVTYPHFVYYTQQYLADLIGEGKLKEGGLQIHTTIDPFWQKTSQGLISQKIKELSELKISNASILVTKNATGEISAMVGSKDYYATDIDGFVNVTTALRQPGSSIKPLNYAQYLEKGHTLTSLLKDTKVTYDLPNGEKYTPENYDSKFRGDVTVRRALANSLNIPSLRVIEQDGIEEFAQYTPRFGLDPWPKENWGLALSLGAGEVRMIKMNQAYSVFPSGGKQAQVTPIRYIQDTQGNIVYFNPCLYTKASFGERKFLIEPGECQKQVIPQDVAFLINSVLTDHKARAEAFGADSILNLDGVGAKTGTTNELRDNWTFGYNSEYTVGVWVGNNDNTPMDNVVSGVTGAAPIWHYLMNLLTTDGNKIRLETLQPPTVEKVRVCAPRNSLACRSCDSGEEYYIKSTAPKSACLDPKPKPPEEEEDEEDEDED